ncbi:hypothetical protein GALL_392400 [mine drainage metagenome]|uniref:Uncharacterized protein n=1 Tax=mine drainage metagenome TaxID=410659 RepID=A0A1J5Q770_9ZZZZ
MLESRSFVRSLNAFGAFWFDFLIGDDWRGTVGIVLAFILTTFLHHSGAVSWWVVPLAVAAILPFNLFRLTRRR